MHGDDPDDSPVSPPLTSSCSPRSPPSGPGGRQDSDDAPATYPVKQFSFVQIMGPKSTDVHKVRKVVRVNAAKASAEARKRTIAQRQQRHSHAHPQHPHDLDLAKPVDHRTGSLVTTTTTASTPTTRPQAEEMPDHRVERTVAMRHAAVVPPPTTYQATTGRFVPLPSAGHGTSDWKVNIANLVHQGTPSPTPEDSRNVPGPSQVSVDRTSP